MTEVYFILILTALGHGVLSWTDPNRLEVSDVNVRNGEEIQRHKIQKWFHRNRDMKTKSMEYVHNVPVVITAVDSKIYKSREDPALFYGKKPVTITVKHYKNDETDTPYKISQTVDGGFDLNGRFNENKQRKNDYKPSHKQSMIYNRRNKTRIHPKTRKRIIRYKSYEDNSVPDKLMYRPSKIQSRNECVRCPSERILVAAKGKEKALLEPPVLYDCNGNVAKNVNFQALYGPKIGALLKEGTHTTVGTIVTGDKALQLCQYRNTVIVNRCPPLNVPPGVRANCPKDGTWGTICRFRCSNSVSNLNLKGPSRIKCKDDMTWSSEPPVCKVFKSNNRTRCDFPNTPKFIRLSCNTLGESDGNSFPEGSTCSARCLSEISNEELSEDEDAPMISCKGGLWEGALPACRRKHK